MYKPYLKISKILMTHGNMATPEHVSNKWKLANGFCNPSILNTTTQAVLYK